MRFIIFMVILLQGISAFSQKLDSVQQNSILSSIDSIDLKIDFRKAMDSCDKYLAYNFLDNNFKARLLVKKAMILNQTKLNWYAIDDSLKSITDSLFIEAIEMCTDCKLEFVMKKITTNHYRHTGPVKEDYDNSILKLYGYKAPSLFIAVSPQYFYGNNQWMGIEFSFPSSLRPPNVVKDSCRGKLETYYKTDMIATSMFGLGFKKNISVADTWGMNISYLSFTYKWINVRPINFSYMNNVVNKSWGYSPELGFQFWHFHLNAGYNLAFRKSMRDYEKLYFTAKFDIPLFREYI